MRRWARCVRAAVRALAGRGAARARPARRGARAGGVGAQRLRPGRVPAAPARPGRAARPLARAGWWRSRAVGTSPASPAACPTARTSSSRSRRRAGAALRGPLHRGQAHPAPDPRTRARRERFERPAPLVLLGGFPGEWEGEHPLEVVRETGDAGRVPGRLARPRGPARRPQRRRPAGAALGARAVRRRCSWRRWPAACRWWPWTRTGRRRSSDAGETGWLVPPDDEDAHGGRAGGGGQRRRRAAAARRGVPTRRRAPATPGRRWRAASPRCTTEVRSGRPAAAGAHTLLEA